MRTPWPNWFPPVFVHAPYRSNGAAQGLWNHPFYTPAKSQRDAYAALELIDSITRDEVVENIANAVAYHGNGRGPLVLAPTADLSESGNALALAYAEWLATDIDCQVEERIYQRKNVSRDQRGAWFRMAHGMEFYGKVEPDTDYILVDDVMTMGGTLADLKGYVESNGGRVICMSVLARDNGADATIALDGRTRSMVRYKFGNEFDRFCQETLGYDSSCLTFQEAEHILRSASIDEARARILGERDQGDSR